MPGWLAKRRMTNIHTATNSNVGTTHDRMSLSQVSCTVPE